MSNYELYEFPGKPIPLARHRNAGRRCYDPQKKKKAEVVQAFKATFKEIILIQDPIKLILRYSMPIPKSHSLIKSNALLGRVHSIRPDLSNLVKFTEDVFNGIIWKDDSLIFQIDAEKVWDTIGLTSIGVIW